MNKLPTEKRVQILNMLCEGSSMRSISRVVGVSINTVTKLLIEAGNACVAFHDEMVKNVAAKHVQCDEIWSFCYAKEKNIAPEHQGILGYGDIWTWTAIDADSKLIISWLVGARDSETARDFINDLPGRLSSRVQLTTDGHKAYLNAVDNAFGGDIDYAMLIKLYGESCEGQRRYSPSECVGTEKRNIAGSPEEKHISTRRRFTRLTNGFSKKIENHEHALSLYFVYYNFVRIHKTLKVTPAMEAGIIDKLFSMEDILKITDGYLEQNNLKNEQIQTCKSKLIR